MGSPTCIRDELKLKCGVEKCFFEMIAKSFIWGAGIPKHRYFVFVFLVFHLESNTRSSNCWL
jgi:hypothetical protein